MPYVLLDEKIIEKARKKLTINPDFFEKKYRVKPDDPSALLIVHKTLGGKVKEI